MAQSLKEVSNQTAQALAALQALERDDAESQPSTKPVERLKLLSAEESTQGGLGDVFELPVEYDDDEDQDNKTAQPQSSANANASHGTGGSEIEKGEPAPSKQDKDGEEAEVLINRVGRSSSGYQSRLQEIEARRRIMATVVVMLIGAAVATIIAWAVFKSGVVNGQYRLSHAPAHMSEKNHFKGTAPEHLGHKHKQAFGADGQVGLGSGEVDHVAEPVASQSVASSGTDSTPIEAVDTKSDYVQQPTAGKGTANGDDGSPKKRPSGSKPVGRPGGGRGSPGVVASEEAALESKGAGTSTGDTEDIAASGLRGANHATLGHSRPNPKGKGGQSAGISDDHNSHAFASQQDNGGDTRVQAKPPSAGSSTASKVVELSKANAASSPE